MDSYQNKVLAWRMFMTSSMKAAIHLGQDFLENSEIYKNTKFENIENVFNITQKLLKRTFWRNSECEAPGSFTLMDEINTLQRQRDQVGEGKSLCLRRFISMCGWKRAADAKWTGQIEDLMRYPSYRDAVGLDGGAIEFERKNFPGFTTLTTGKKEHRAGEFQRPDHLCLWITTSSGKGMMRIASRTPRNSRIAQTGFYQDVVGLSWVEVRKRDGTVAHLMDHATVQPTKWYSNEKKLVILFSLPPVLWVAEVWSEEMAKVPFTLMEISWTRNYYFKQLNLWIKWAFTRLLRIGVTTLLWRRKKITPSYTREQSSYGCCGSRRSGYVDIFSTWHRVTWWCRAS